MRRRWKVEVRDHGYCPETLEILNPAAWSEVGLRYAHEHRCHCLQGIGSMRKKRPYASNRKDWGIEGKAMRRRQRVRGREEEKASAQALSRGAHLQEGVNDTWIYT